MIGIGGATGAGAAVIGLSQQFAKQDLGGGDAAYGTLFGTVFVGLARGMFLGPRLIGTSRGAGSSGSPSSACGITLRSSASCPTSRSPSS